MGEKVHLCPRCGRRLSARFLLPGHSGAERVCVICAAGHRSFVHDGVRVSAVVGTLLTAVNQGQVLLAGDLTVSVAARVLFTYAVPFAVSLFTSVHLCAAAAGPGEPPAEAAGEADAS